MPQCCSFNLDIVCADVDNDSSDDADDENAVVAIEQGTLKTLEVQHVGIVGFVELNKYVACYTEKVEIHY